MTDDDFDFYPCLVDGAPASIYVNQRYEPAGAPGADTRYDVVLPMRDAGGYGIGSEAEGAELDRIEEALIARAGELGLIYVGRLRSHGEWTSTFYGPPGEADALRAIATELTPDRRATVQHEADGAWRYYHELLLPDDERRRWMDNRRLVQVLADQGDGLRTPRRVDHRASFPGEAARDAFLEAARQAGFASDGATAASEGRAGATVYRTDPIELDHIHDVVMTLVDAATLHGGTYDGWTAAITP